MLVQLVEHDLRNRIRLEVDDDVDAVAIRAVVDVADLRQLLLAHELAEFLEQALAIDLVRNLLDNDGVAAVLLLFDLALGADGDRAATGVVRVDDALLTHDQATRREVRAGQHGHQLFGRRVGVVDQHAHRIDGFAEVVRRDVRGHADGDACRAVYEQIRETRGKNRRLLEALIVVRLEIDGFLVEVS